MLSTQLKHWAEKEPEKTALQIRDADGYYRRVTYGDLYAGCLKLKASLESMGYKPGDNISVYGDNSPEWVISYIGINFLGGTVIPLDALMSPGEVFNFLEFSNTGAVIVDDAHAGDLREELTEKGSDIAVIRMESLINDSDMSKSGEPHQPAPDDLFAILFTSGTTGTPKGVQLSNENVFSNVQALLKSVDVTDRDNILNILPLHHGYSSIVALLTPLWAGATVTFSESIKSRDLLAAIRETGVTIFPGVPRLFELLYNGIESRTNNLPFSQKVLFKAMSGISESVWKSANIRLGKLFFGKIHGQFGDKFRFFTSGGAKLDPKIYSGFLTLGFKIAEGYGLTETSAVSTLTSPDIPNPGSAGKPLPGVEIRIDNPDDTGTGEICIRGPNITRGYFRNQAATDELLKNGWLHSGDLGHMDAQGNLFITGRAKEVIVLPSGKNIYPEDVENLYKKNPILKEICVIPQKTASGGTKGLGVVVVPDMKEVREQDVFDIRDKVRSIISMTGSSLPSYMQISEILIYNDELPKTRLGKFRRNEVENLADQLRSGALKQAAVLTPEDKELLERPVSITFLKRFTDITEVKGPFRTDDDLTLDLGIDSLTQSEITSLLESEFGVILTEDEIPEVRTIGDILRRLPDNAEGTESVKTAASEIPKRQPAEPLDEMYNLERGVVKKTAIRLLQLVLRLIAWIAFRSSLGNKSAIPRDRPVLICPNHQSLIDPVLVYALLPGEILEKTLFTGFGEYFSKPPLSWIVRPMRIILTGTGRTSAESLRLATEGLRRGMNVCIFPEGERTSTGTIMKPRIGAGLLSVETGAPIVPIYFEGATATLSPINPGLAFPKISLTVMDLIEPSEGGAEPREEYQRTVDKWYEAMVNIEESRS